MAFQWKMNFCPDPSKQAQEVIFSRKLQKSTHPTLNFNKYTVTQSVTQKHIGMLLDTKMDFQGHLKSVLNTVNKTVWFLRKLHNTLPRLLLLAIYKSFVRPHLDNGYIIYDQAYKLSFHQRLESAQYDSAVAITGAIRGTFTEKLYNLIMSEVWKPLKKEDGTGNYAASTKFIKLILQNTFLKLFPLLWVDITQRILTAFLSSK